MVGSVRKNDKSKNDTDWLAQSSYGYSDEQFLERMEMAEATIPDDQIPSSPEGDFNRLELERRRREENAYIENSACLLKPLIRVATVMAIIGSVLMLTSVTVGAKRSGEYNRKERAASLTCSSLFSYM